jgi:pimeloyl-ACP methyl ester carboxylesterase
VSGRRTAVVTAGLAAGAVASGAVGRALLRSRRREDPAAHEVLSLLPPETIHGITSHDGTRLEVRAAGPPDAPTIVFVHGFSLDLTTWHYQWTSLSARFRCVLFDLRSHGHSAPAMDGDVSPRSFGRDLAAVLDGATEGPVVLVGHSLGSLAILAAAEQRPDLFAGRVAGVVFVGAAMADLWRGVIGSVTRLLRPRLGSIQEAASRVNRLRRYVVSSPLDVGHVVARLTQFGPDAPPSVIDYVVALAARSPSNVWTDGLVSLMDADLRDAVRAVRVPALVVVGGHDRMTPPSSGVALADALPDGRLELIDRAGHLAMLETPDDFNEILDRFARRQLSAPSGRRARRRSA